jgi:hypothetical protein
MFGGRRPSIPLGRLLQKSDELGRTDEVMPWPAGSRPGSAGSTRW